MVGSGLLLSMCCLWRIMDIAYCTTMEFISLIPKCPKPFFEV